MQRFKNILCVVKPDEASRPALERGVSLAENNQARLTVVDVLAPDAARAGADAGPGGAESQGAMALERSRELELFIQAYRQRVGIRHYVLMGTGALEVIRTVLRDRHDLVIKAAENLGLRKRLLGSDDMHLLRKCPCPVWLTRPEEASNYGCILAAVDFDPDAPDRDELKLNEQIIEISSSLALSDFAELHLVHAWDAPGETTVRTWSDLPEAASMYAEGARDAHQRGLDRLGEQLRARLGAEAFDYLSPRFHLRRGPATQAIPDIAREMRADLVVMGTVARTGIAAVLIGNTAESILNQLTCSVLAIKPVGFVSPVGLPR